MPLETDGRLGTPLLPERSLTSPPSDGDRGRSVHRSSNSLTDSITDPLAPAAPELRSLSTGSSRLSRRQTMRSLSPATNARLAVRRKYIYASFFLVVSLISFAVQTELAAWVQHAGWNKAYCMLYLTHGSWSLLWPVQLLVLRVRKRSLPWHSFWRRHLWLLRTTAVMVETRHIDAHRLGYREHISEGRLENSSHIIYMAKVTSFITCSLTVAGLSWYVAVNMTSPSDLTAIYNCSAFFAYAFSVPLLHERLRLDKSLAVLVAVAGVMVVAYGDSMVASAPPDSADRGDLNANEGNRFLGNIIIGIGSVLYGLYEVLYKRFACPPDGCSPGRGVIFANTFGSCIGIFTLSILWVPLPVLHFLGIETFVLPSGKVAWYLFLSVVMNATFAGTFLVLISLTSPVLTSVASLLTIFIVAISDWLLTGEPPSTAALFGGSMIVVAFVLLSWSTYREMTEDEQQKEMDMSGGEDDSSEEDEIS